MGILCLATNVSMAQITADFNDGQFPSGACWQNNAFKITNGITNVNKTLVVSGHGNAYASLTTPFIVFPSDGTGTISFVYNAIDKSIGLFFNVSIISNTGIKTQLSTINATSKTYTTYTSPFVPSGTYRVMIEYVNAGSTGGYGSNYANFDNLNISGEYDAVYACNLAPLAVADNYSSSSMATPLNCNVLQNDTDPNNETLTITSFTQPATGTVTKNADGTLTFTPSASFTGGQTSFNYTITDNGTTPLSATTTVTLTYPSAPVAVDDNFGSTSISAPFSGHVVLNDTKPNGLDLMATLSKSTESGTLAFNADGTFTYTPAEGFTGGPVSFTYYVTDNSFAPLFSNTATVTIEYATAAVLPIRFVSFSGSLQASKANLNWSVAENETGSFFEIEKSLDGKTFRAATIVYTSTTVGIESYKFADPAELQATTYYRIKTFNKDNSISYSNVISLKHEPSNLESKLTLLQNPVRSTLSFSFSSSMDEKAKVSIYNLAGVKVYSQNVAVKKGTNSFSFDMDTRIGKGNYIVTVESATSIKSSQFIQQ